MDVVLVINSGSTSLKFGVYPADATVIAAASRRLTSHSDGSAFLTVMCRGQVDFSSQPAQCVVKDAHGHVLSNVALASDLSMDHAGALQHVIAWLTQQYPAVRVRYAGHRLVQGGERFRHAVVLNDDVLDYLEGLCRVEPSHQRYEVLGARVLAALFPDMVQVASFDTAFHRTMPAIAQHYAVPVEIEAKGVKHWGYHGISYDYLARQIAIQAPLARRVVMAHLGGGASLCGMLDGVCQQTSMQFGALSGVPMATRSGDFPTDAVFYLLRECGYSVSQLEAILYQQSGLLGLSGGFSADMRMLLSSDLPQAKYAIDFFNARVVEYVGAYAAVIGGLDALVFSAGIGESAAPIREAICRQLAWMGITLNKEANEQAVGVTQCISTPDSRVAVWVIPTNEEAMIAQNVLEVLGVEVAYSL